MSSATENHTPSRIYRWATGILFALPPLMLVMSGIMKLRHPPEAVQAFVGHFGYAESALTYIGLAELSSAILYLLPWTRFLGALLLTGYLGGAIATHVRIGEPFVFPLALAVVMWLGYYLRDSRVRALLPSLPVRLP